MNALEAKNIFKNYSGYYALKDVSVVIPDIMTRSEWRRGKRL